MLHKTTSSNQYKFGIIPLYFILSGFNCLSIYKVSDSLKMSILYYEDVWLCYFPETKDYQNKTFR